jgi:hypothetical protein
MMKPALATVFLFTVVGRLSSESLVHLVPAQYDLSVDNPRYVSVHAEILSLSAPETSFAQLATAKLRIHAVLRGRNKTTRAADASFSPPLLHESMVDPMKGNYELKPEAKQRKYSLPPVGSHVLLAYCCVDQESGMVGTQNYLVLWSPENEAKVLKTATPVEASTVKETALFWLMCGLPILGFILTGLGFGRLWRMTYSAPACFAAAFLADGVYESGISNYTDIRVDLLIIIPIMILNFHWACLEFN